VNEVVGTFVLNPVFAKVARDRMSAADAASDAERNKEGEHLDRR
jgi:hypothetical protein